MRARTLVLLATTSLACSLLGAGSAVAAAPGNDNYLASLQMVEGDAVPREFRHEVDTTEATTQGDLFDPNRDGIPFGGAEPEATRCGAAQYGKTVWYDF